MKILLTGANGCIGKQLLPLLLEKGHEVTCYARNSHKFDLSPYPNGKASVIEADFLNPNSLKAIPKDIDAAYYLIHSMAQSTSHFDELEKTSAANFVEAMSATAVKQVIYLSGIANSEKLSKHLKSRKHVEQILKTGQYSLTTLRAGIVVGEGSGSIEIIRDLVEKLPVMVAPRWLKTLLQPISVINFLEYLTGVLMKDHAMDKDFDIGHPEVLTYKQMLLQYARVRGHVRWVFIVPVMTPKLSSYWLYFISSTTYNLAVNLAHSMKVGVICRPNDLAEQLSIEPMTYIESVADVFKHSALDLIKPVASIAQPKKSSESKSSKVVDVPE